LFSSSVWKQYHGPLYFVLLHLWAKLGTAEAMLRTLSVLIGSVALCLTYATALKLLHRRAALISSILLATSPFFIWYSQEVRYISLMISVALLSMLGFWSAIHGRGLVLWLVCAGTLAVALFSFVTCLFLVASQGTFLILSRTHRPLLLKWGLVQMPVF